MRPKYLLSVALIAACLLSVQSSADSTPQVIRLQGFLTDTSGGGDVPANGTLTMTFDLYDSELGGVLLGSVTPPGGVLVQEGIYSVDLGFPVTEFNASERWIEVSVSGETLLPRIRFVSTPYTYVADTVDGFEGAELDQSADVAGLQTDVAGLQGQTASLTNDLDAHESGEDAHPEYVDDAGDVMSGSLEIHTNVASPLTLTSSEPTAVLRLEGAVDSKIQGTQTDTTKTLSVTAGANGAFITLMGKDADNVGTGGGTLLLESARSSSTGDVLVRTRDQSRVIVNQDGKVGIGTLNPAANLHVSGNVDQVFALSSLQQGSQFELLAVSSNGIAESQMHFNGIFRAFSEDTQELVATFTGSGVEVPVLSITGGADIAEPFEIAPGEEVKPGEIVVIDPQSPGLLRRSATPYDRGVVGVASGAGGVNPGLTLNQDSVFERGMPIALSGRVYVLASHENGAIAPGDFLTSSSEPGRAMKATSEIDSRGAIIGKALSPADDTTGLVLTLVNLQ